MKKRILALLLALVMCLSLLPTAAFAEGGIDTDNTAITGSTGDTDSTTDTPADTTDEGGDEDEDTAPTPMVQSAGTPVVLTAGTEHTVSDHCVCGATHNSSYSGHSSTATWSPLLVAETPPTTGNYYLIEDVTLSDSWNVTGNLVLCLNGHTITANGDFPAITVSGGATLFLTDCGGTGKVIYGGRTEGCTVKVTGGTFKLYNGTITHAAGTSGSGVRVESSGKFEMYGGTISGNSGMTRTNPDNSTAICGGGVYIASGGTFDMSGGSITGNKALSNGFAGGGGGVYIEPVKDTALGGTFNMSGGSITNNTATDGGGVFIGDRGTFNMSGGEISGNTANKGGGIFAHGMFLDNTYNSLKFTMSGGSITGNNATENGGGVYGAGAYHEATGSGENLRPSKTAQEGSVFQLSGTANVTGNTLNGTKGTNGKYTGGTKNNMYVLSWVYSIHVTSGFSGNFGVTVDEYEWADTVSGVMQGAHWQVVKHEGIDNSSLPDGITYDNERFSFEINGSNRGRVTCNHFGAAKKVSSENVCSICGSTSVEAEVTFADANKTKRCYVMLQTAIKEAGNDGKVKLLKGKDVELNNSTSFELDPQNNTVALDLNGYKINVTNGSITIKNGTLDITGNAGSKIDCSGGLQVQSGAKLIVSGTEPEINKLTVQNGGAATLKGGKYSEITVLDGMTCNDLLADGYAYFDQTDTTSLKSGKVQTLINVTVGEHSSCVFTNGGTCACGRECPHSNINTATGKCTGCAMQMVAQVTKENGGIADETAYFASFEDAVDSIKTNDRNVTIKLLAAAGIDEDLTIDKACTLDLNGHKLTIENGKKLTVNNTVTIKGTGSSKIDGELEAGASADLTIKGTPTIRKLTVTNASATVALKGGSFDSIDASSAEKKIASLLAPGYAFGSTASTSQDESRSLYSQFKDNTSYSGLKVVQCSPHSVNEDEGNNCMFCNTAFAVSVNVGNDYTYCQTLSEAVAYITGSTNGTSNVPNTTTTHIYIKLLANVTEQNGNTNKTIEFNRRNPLTLSLNGKTLTADIEVASGTTLTVNGISGTLNGTLTVASGGNAKLSSGTFSKITVASGNVGGLLADGYGYQYTAGESEGTWPEGDVQTIQNVSVQKLPIKSVDMSPYGASVAYGTPVSLTATVKGFDDKEITDGVTYKWYRKVGNDTTEVGTDKVYTTSTDFAVGEYYFICAATVDGYTAKSSPYHCIRVYKADLSDTHHPTAKTGLTFTTEKVGSADPRAVAQELVTAPTTLPTGCTVHYSLDKNTWGTDAAAIEGTDAGTYTVYWYITGGDNYNGVGSKDEPESLTVQIAPKKIMRKPSAGSGIDELHFRLDFGNGDCGLDSAPNQTYTGEAIEPTIQLEDVNGYVITSGYSVTYDNNTNASTYEKPATITIKDTDLNDNFEIGDSVFSFSIALKPVTLDSYTVYVTTGGNVNVDLDEVAKALGMPANDGNLTFESSDNGSSYTSYSGTRYTQDNVNDATTKYFRAFSNNHWGKFVVNVVVTEKTIPAISVNNFTKTYDGTAVTVGDVTENATATANGDIIAGTWSWTKTGTAPTNVADSGMYLLTFTPTNTAQYTSATATVQVTITPLSISIAGADLKPKPYDGNNTVEIGNGGVYIQKQDDPNTPVRLTMGTDYTATATLSSPFANNTQAQVTVTLLTGNYKLGDYNNAAKLITCQVVSPAPLTVTAQAAPKTYDGDTSVDSYSVSFDGIVSNSARDSLDPTKDYTVTAAFADADAGTGKKVIVTVTLSEDTFSRRYCFMVNDEARRSIQVETTADIYPLTLTTLPTVKADVVHIQQDVSVTGGSYSLPDNVELTLPEGFSPNRELRFTLGDLPAKVEATIGEGGMLTYTISGGRSGEKFAIPVTVTLPNFVYSKDGGAAAVALFAQDDQVQEIDPNAETITLSFTVEIELTGGGHEHIRRQPIGTGTSGGNGNTGGNGVASPATGDAGIALYGVLTVLSLTGGAWIRRKKR